MHVFLNGRFVSEEQAVVPVSDRGFLLGDGLFETMRVVGGKPFRFAQHLERMTLGAEFLKIRLPFTLEEMQEFAGQLIKKNQMPNSILRMTLTRGSGGRGYLPKSGNQPTLAITLHAARSLEKPAEWNLVTSSFRLSVADPLASLKTTSKIRHVMARIEATGKRADEALLLNTNGEVAETASGNLFWIDDRQVYTAPVSCGILPGITRAVVMEICRKLGLPVNQHVAKPDTLKNADGLFVTQSASGIVSVMSLDAEPVVRSPLVNQIARVYHEMLL